jgi:hypothetical protein
VTVGDALHQVVEHALQFGRQVRTVQGPDLLERALAVTAWHRWRDLYWVSPGVPVFLVDFSTAVDSELPGNVSVFTYLKLRFVSV